MTDKPLNNKPPRIKLPFEKRSEDPGEWAYDHRVGLCVTVIAYLLLAIVFVSSKIIIGQKHEITGFIIDIQPDPKEAPIEKPDPDKVLQNDDFSNIRNRVSNENASELNERLRDAKGTDASKIYDEADEAQNRMKANREAYERGLKEDQSIRNSKNNTDNGKDNKQQDVKEKGKVVVSFSLTNPLRTSSHLYIPAYRCEGGGEVIIAITVNQNGNVIDAKVSKTSSSADKCMIDTAIEAAYKSRFNIDTAAPAKHQGTIDYVFIPQ